jgi:hypothetical protein
MTYPTDNQIEAARAALIDAVNRDNPPDGWSDWLDQDVLEETLIAAREAEPPPSVEEFDVALEALTDYWEPIYHAERTAPIAGCGLPRNWDGMVKDFESARQALRDLFVKAAGR